MAEPPFRCSIRYPEHNSTDKKEEDQNSFEMVHKSEAEDLTPVVILLGWAGCQEKHLFKYSTIYEKKGYITANLIAPYKSLFFASEEKVNEVARGLLDILDENGLLDHPLLVHVFSNGGCLVYSRLALLLRTTYPADKVALRGIIFDSAPGKRRIVNGVRAFMDVLPCGQVLSYLMGLIFLLYLLLNRILLHLLPIRLGSALGFELFETIATDPGQCPHLFLYSKSDQVVLSEDVEEMATIRQQNGVSVKSICWDDSKHVAHLRVHPEVYTKACLDFSEACLSNKASS